MISILDAAIDGAGKRLCAAAQAIGGSIIFDRTVALSRDQPSTGTAQRKSECRLLKAQDSWMAVTLARDEDYDALPAWTQRDVGADPWDAIGAFLQAVLARDALDRAVLLQLPVSIVGDALPQSRPDLDYACRAAERPTVLDTSALWAGPYCGGLLAEAGCNVMRLTSPARPDPTPQTMPQLHARLNGRKRTFDHDLGDAAFWDLLSCTDVLITSARPHALARLGLSEDAVFAARPSLIWVAITAHGWTQPVGYRVGFGDDCAAAGGLVNWTNGMPMLMGDALADPLTGLLGATYALEALAQGKSGLIDIALSRTAARFAQDAGLAG